MSNMIIAVLVAVSVLVLVVMLRPGVDQITSEEAHQLVEQGALLVDVRTPGEYVGGHIEGARNIPLAELEGRLDEVGDPSADVIIVYCRSGHRSGQAAGILEDSGFTQVHNLGGMSRW